MQTAYLERVEQDEALHRAIGPVLPALQRLTADQVETLVFYLKSLHGYYPASENSSSLNAAFEKKLEALRDSPLQRAAKQGSPPDVHRDGSRRRRRAGTWAGGDCPARWP